MSNNSSMQIKHKCRIVTCEALLHYQEQKLYLCVQHPPDMLNFDASTSSSHTLRLSSPVHSSCSDSSSVGSQKEGGSPASGRDPRTSSGSTSYSQVGSECKHEAHRLSEPKVKESTFYWEKLLNTSAWIYINSCKVRNVFFFSTRSRVFLFFFQCQTRLKASLEASTTLFSPTFGLSGLTYVSRKQA